VIDGVTKHEQEVQTRIAALRQSADLSNEIMFLAEDYPVLKSAENFLFLQRELARTEEIIAMARSFHNDSILAYNNLRATIPGMVLSPFFPQKKLSNPFDRSTNLINIGLSSSGNSVALE
jgi:hypothetical protein